MISLLSVLILVFLLAASAFFSGSETALFSLKTAHLNDLQMRKPRGGKNVLGLIAHPRKLLIVILLGNMFANVAFSSLTAGMSFERWGHWGPVVFTIPVILIVLIFGEILPKTIAVLRPLRFSLTVSIPIKGFMTLTAPLWAPLEFILKPFFPAHASSRDRMITREEIHSMAEISGIEGVLKSEELDMIRGIMELSELTSRDIAVPRTEVTGFSVDQSPMEAARICKAAGFSRFPVYRESTEEIVGIVEAVDFLDENALREKTLKNLLKPISFIPDRKRLGDLLEELQSTGEKIVAVVDEYGSFSGIVTWRDLVEEVLGEILTHREEAYSRFIDLGGGRIIVPARMEVERFNELFKTHLASSGFHTLGGYLLERIQRFPEEGETFYFDGLTFRIHKAQKNRITQIEVSKKTSSAVRR